MKYIYLITLLLFTSVTMLSQTRRIKLHQIEKDTTTGSILITGQDSDIKYSRDFYITQDSFLILYGDTVGKSSLSSVLTDGITILGTGVSGDVLKVDTINSIATKADLTLKQDVLTNPITGTGTINYIPKFSSSSEIQSSSYIREIVDTVYIDTFLNVDNGTLYVDAVNNRVGIGTSTPNAKLSIDGRFNSSTSTSYIIINDLDTDGGFFAVQEATGGDDKTYPAFYLQGKGDFGGNITFGGFFAAYIDSLPTEVSGNIAWYFDARRRNKPGSTTLPLTAGTTFFFGNYGTKQLEILHNNNIYNGNNTTTFNTLSDARDKTNIQELQIGLNLINKLNPVAYTWQSRDGKRVGIKDIGFLAQDFDGALYNLPQSDYTSLVEINSDGNYTLSLSQMFPIYVKAIQEQQTIIENQNNKITQLEQTINNQSQLIQQLITRIENLENN